MALVPQPKGTLDVRSFADLPDTPPVRTRRDIQPAAKRLLVTAWISACGSRCIECTVHMIRPRPGCNARSPRTATIDHIRARALGGSNALANLRVICGGCNCRKSRNESRAVEERRRAYRQRARKAALTRARNKALAEAAAAAAAAARATHKARIKARNAGTRPAAAAQPTAAM